MKKVVVVFLVLLATSGVFAYWFPSQGMVLTFQETDGRGRVQQFARYTVISVTGTQKTAEIQEVAAEENNATEEEATEVAEATDETAAEEAAVAEDENNAVEEETVVAAEENVETVAQQGNLLNMVIVQKVEYMDARRRPKGDAALLTWTIENGCMVSMVITVNDMVIPMETPPSACFPSNIRVGYEFEERSDTVGTAPMQSVVFTRDHKIVSRESITTPAVTFDAYKETSTVGSKMINNPLARERITKSVSWYTCDY